MQWYATGSVNRNASRPDQRCAGLTQRGFRQGSFPKIHAAEKSWIARERGDNAREAGLEVDRVFEEEAEVALRARIVRGQEAGRQREHREHEQRDGNPSVRTPGN